MKLVALTAVIIQAAFLTVLAIEYPENADVSDGDRFDFVIVGGGTAGCVLATRLTEVSSFRVLLIEAGGDPTEIADLPGDFAELSKSRFDWNYTSVPDGVTAQYLKDNVHALTSGKMLGGSGSLHHMMHLRGFSYDYDNLVKVTADSSWSYDNMLQYFKKSENLQDPEILESPTADLHGKNGNLGDARQPDESTGNYLDSFKELGNNILLDVTEKDALGYGQGLLLVSNGTRQTTSNSYLSPARNRKNLYVLKNTLVTKILFKLNKAVGVNVRTNDGKELKIRAKEVIVSAGALKTPQLLMLSGIGPKNHLKKFNIRCIADLPVGLNYQDRPSVMLLYKMEESNETVTPPPPTKYPAPTVIGAAALDKFQNRPDYQTVIFLLPHDALTFMAVCGSVFNYKDETCQTFYNDAKGRNTMLTFFVLPNPKSRGKIELQSTNPEDAPLIDAGILSNRDDLTSMAKGLVHYNQILNTTYFKDVGATLVDPELEECKPYEFGSEDYFKCYALSMNFASWEYSSTCSLGAVVNSNFRVKNVKRLRVVDASILPRSINSEYFAPVVAIAEKAADLIKCEKGFSRSC